MADEHLQNHKQGTDVQALSRVIAILVGRDVKLKPLGGGLTNRNYRLDGAGASYAVRIAGEGTDRLGINRERERACARAAAEAGVGPKVIDALCDSQTLVTAFLPGKALTKEDLADANVLCRVVAAIRRCHAHPVPAELESFPPFEPFDVIRGYRRLAMKNQTKLPRQLDQAMPLLDRIEKKLARLKKQTPSDGSPCLCHNDLLAANFLDDGTTVRIIDWEYASRGGRFFDLGNFAANHKLSDRQEQTVLALYFPEGEASAERLRQLRLMRCVSDLREATWSFVQAGISTLQPKPKYKKRGRKHLDRFMKAARSLLT